MATGDTSRAAYAAHYWLAFLVESTIFKIFDYHSALSVDDAVAGPHPPRHRWDRIEPARVSCGASAL